MFRLLPDGSVEPYLARSIERTGRSATVELVDARWSDGAPITARDVVLSARRARPGDGFAGLRVEAIGERTVRFVGPSGAGWEERLAARALVLPRGRAGRAFGGPYTLERYEKGYEVVLRRNPRFMGSAVTRRIRVRFVQDLDVMLLLLERGRLDAAAPLSTVNLDERLEELGIESAQRVGSERIWLDHASAPPSAVDALLRSLQWRLLEQSFVRDDGRLVLNAERGPAPSPQTFRLIGSESDELVGLLMRAAWFRLRDAGHTVELLRADPALVYGRWQDAGPAGVFVERRAGVPGVAERRAGIRAFAVATVTAWNEGVEGVEVNPSIEGPLWNAERLGKRL